MEVTETFYAADRAAWRQWLAANHATAKEIWLLSYAKESDKGRVAYLQAVEEAVAERIISDILPRLKPEASNFRQDGVSFEGHD